MNISYRWLQAVAPGLDLDPTALQELLALRGAPVEEVVSLGEDLRDIVIGRVVASGRHPNADRLSLCTVDGGQGPVQVICGAPNVKEGGWYPFAPVGAVLPGNLKIKKAKIRGEHSAGMLCSARELGLGTDHTGILELEGAFEPGQSFVEALDLADVRLDVEITTNRGDLLSHVGVAREVAPGGIRGVTLPPIPEAPGIRVEYEVGTPEVERGGVRIRIEDEDLCHRYLGAVIRGVSVGPSPPWLQNRLRAAGSRPINNVVDATNYVLLEMGQPMHAFDLNRLGGSSVVVRRARADEATLTTLDGEARRLAPDMLMICDADTPVAVGGVMGGLDSEVDATTTDVLLECALFDPASIRSTRKALGLSTDASYRFERGVDPEGMTGAMERAVELILATAGGTLDGPVLDVCPRPFQARVVPLRLSRVEHLLGIGFSAQQVRALLEPLGFAVELQEGGTLDVRVPGFRSYDVLREVDLIEEVARTHGFDAFPEKLGPFRPGTVPDHPMFLLEDELRHALAQRGLFEAQTPAFVPESEGEVRVANPLNVNEPVVRREVLPSLLRRVEYNLARDNRDVRLFEIATAFHRVGPGKAPHEETHLALALTGRREPPHWSREDEPLSVWDLKALVEDVARWVWGAGASVVPVQVTDPYAEGCALEIRNAEGVRVGHAGRIREGHLDAPAWAGAVWGAEIKLSTQIYVQRAVTFQPLPQHPATERDLALLVKAGVTASQVEACIREAAGSLMEALQLFDLYEGEGLPEGTRSLAYRLRFRAPGRTLRDREADDAVRSVLKRLAADLDVGQRG